MHRVKIQVSTAIFEISDDGEGQRTREQPYPITVPADDHAIAVVLDFVNPLVGHPFGDRGQTGLDETGGIMPRGGDAPQHCGGLIPESTARVESRSALR
jgi:hypothetical protein